MAYLKTCVFFKYYYGNTILKARASLLVLFSIAEQKQSCGIISYRCCRCGRAICHNL